MRKAEAGGCDLTRLRPRLPDSGLVSPAAQRLGSLQLCGKSGRANNAESLDGESGDADALPLMIQTVYGD